MAILDTTHYRDLKDADTGEILNQPAYTAVSSDPAVASIGVGVSGSSLAVIGQSNGLFTVTVTRTADGAVGILSGEVGTMDVGSFNVAFGDAHPRG